MRQAVFDTPTAPPGWEGSGVDLIRIVDPLGGAIAWLAPDLGATCVGYAVRRSGVQGVRWTHVFGSAGPRALLARPDCYGCAILSTRPCRWPDANVGLRLRDALALRRWRFIERDPTATVLETSFAPEGEDDGRKDRRSDIRLRLTARLDDAALSLDLEAHNEGDETIFLRLGIQPSLAVGLLASKPAASGKQTSDRAKRCSEPDRAEPVVEADKADPCPEYLEDATDRTTGGERCVCVKFTRTIGVQNVVLQAPHHHSRASLAPSAVAPSGRLLRLPSGTWQSLTARISVVAR